jgi:peptide/nickel transport system substrate-binding protein
MPSKRSLACLFVFLTACSGATKDEGKGASVPWPEDMRIVEGIEAGGPGGRVVCAITSDPKTFNPMLVSETSTEMVIALMFSGLVNYDQYAQVFVPGLAKSWDENGRSWTFHLRKGVRWSDGHPLTADDVLFSFEVLYDSVIHPPGADLLMIDGKRIAVTAADSLTVRMELPAVYGPFIGMIGSLRILPRHKLEEAYRRGEFESTWGVDWGMKTPHEIVVSGPFRVTQFVPNEKIVLGRNPHFWQADLAGTRLPYLDNIIYVNAEDENVVLLKFQAGETDMIQDGFSPESYKLLKDGEDGGNYRIYDIGPRLGSTHLWFNMNPGKNPNTDKPYVAPHKLAWFQSPDFRKAIAHAVDRDGIVKTVFHGRGVPVWGPVSPNNKAWYNADLVTYPHDPVTSSKLLAKMGFWDQDDDGILEDREGRELEFSLGTNVSNTTRVKVGNIIVDDLKKLGVKVNFIPIDFNDMITRMRESFDYEAMMLALTEGVPPDPIMGSNVFLSSGDTHIWFPNQEKPATLWEAEIDSLMVLQALSQDQSLRKRAFDRVQRIMSENIPLIFIVNQNECVAARNTLGNVKPSIMEPFLLHNAEQIFLTGESKKISTGERKISKQAQVAERNILGQWRYDELPYAGIISIFDQAGSLYTEFRFDDGGISKKEVRETSSRIGRRFDPVESMSNGDHWIIDSQGDLQLRDNEGLIGTARNI